MSTWSCREKWEEEEAEEEEREKEREKEEEKRRFLQANGNAYETPGSLQEKQIDLRLYI